MRPETITRAAMKTPDGKVWAVPRPGRHDAVFRVLHENGYESPYHEIQGFLDIWGTFYTRNDAEELARVSKQIEGPLIGSVLTSEDLWDSWRCGYDVVTRTHGHGCGNHYEIPMDYKGKTVTCPKCNRTEKNANS